MKTLIVSAGLILYGAKGQLNRHLTDLTQTTLKELGYDLKFSDTTSAWNMETELAKLLWADIVIYITPIMWFNIPSSLSRWLEEVLVYGKTFGGAREYGEGGLVPASKFMIVATSNLKSSNLGSGFVLRNIPHIDNILQPLILTNLYLSIRIKIPTFHADDVVFGDTSWIEDSFKNHLIKYFEKVSDGPLEATNCT